MSARSLSLLMLLLVNDLCFCDSDLTLKCIFWSGSCNRALCLCMPHIFVDVKTNWQQGFESFTTVKLVGKCSQILTIGG